MAGLNVSALRAGAFDACGGCQNQMGFFQFRKVTGSGVDVASAFDRIVLVFVADKPASVDRSVCQFHILELAAGEVDLIAREALGGDPGADA